MRDGNHLTFRQVLARLRAKHGDRSPGYVRLWTAATEGRFPAEKTGLIWLVHEADLALVERALGLSFDQKTTTPRRRQPTAA